MRILPLTDLHLPKPAAERILANRALLDSVDRVVLLGDMVSAYGTDREYEAVREFLNRLNRPCSVVSGNHEWHFEEFHEDSGLYGLVWSQASNEDQRAKLGQFQKFYELDALWRAESSALGQFVFLSLDRVESQKQEALSDEQLAWFERQLRQMKEGPLFVFCHSPVMLGTQLDMTYYDEERSACVELEGALKVALQTREAPTFWISGHIHLHPEHYLFPPYKTAGEVWQIHCPDSWGYGRWRREQWCPERYDGVFSRVLEIDEQGVTFWTHDHVQQSDIGSYRVDFERKI